MKLLELFIAICIAPFLFFGGPKDESNNAVTPKYICSSGEEYILHADYVECEKYAKWKKEAGQRVLECYKKTHKLCIHDEYPGTGLHWSEEDDNIEPYMPINEPNIKLPQI